MKQADPQTSDLDRLLADSGFEATDSDNTPLSEVPSPDSVEINYPNGTHRSPPPAFLFGEGIIKMAMVDPEATVITT